MSKGGGVKIPSEYKISVGGTGSTISVDADLDNICVKELPRFELAVTEYPTIELDSSVSVKELPRVEVDTNSDVNVAVKELPRIELDTNSSVNANVNIAIKEIPDTRVHLPAHYCVGLSFFGYEIWKLSLCGESQVINEKYVPRRTEICCE